MYTQYGSFKNLVMRWIAKRAGGDTDTTRDREYTDWAALDAFAEAFATELAEARSQLATPTRAEAGH